MIDCSHGNSGKDYRNQHFVLDYTISNMQKKHRFGYGIYDRI